MENVNGVYSIFYIKVGENYLPVGCLTDTSFSETTEMLGTTVRTNQGGWGSFLPSRQTYNIDFSGLVPKEIKETGYVTYYDIQQLKRNRTLFKWKIEGGIDLIEYGEGYLTSLSKNDAIDEFISFSASVQGQGKPLENPQIEGALGYKLGIKL